MLTEENKVNRRRLQSSYITTTISLSLVLFMIGLIGFLLLNANKLSDFVKESINLTVILNPEANEMDILKLQKEFDAMPFIKSTQYITRDKAAKEFSASLGEDFVQFLGYNPLLNSIEVKLRAGYANQDSISKLQTRLKNNSLIKEIVYEPLLIQKVNENIHKISLVILGFSGLLFLIAIALINNTVRLLVYSKRLIIRTMQLVGATKGFIRRPFIYKSIFQGFMSAVIAMMFLFGIIYLIKTELNGIDFFIDYYLFALLFIGIVSLGIIITTICTFFALNKYLNIETDYLY